MSGVAMEAPARGIPEPLPVGERMLWQGAPRWQTLAVTALHVRKLAIYFAILLVWSAAAKLSSGLPPADVAVSILQLGGLALATLGLLTAYAWAVARTTTYTVTSRRVVMRVGVALPMTLNLPYTKIDGAAFRALAGGAGDISLTPAKGERLAYPLLWPHARPWRMKRGEPTLRAIPDAGRVAQLVSRALAAAAVSVQPNVDAAGAAGQHAGLREAA